MTEETRELLYWRACLAFIIFSPLLIYMLAANRIERVFSPGLFFVVLMISIPGTLLADLLLQYIATGRASMRVWLVQPLSNWSHTVMGGALDECLPRVVQRLEEQTFKTITEQGPHGVVVSFGKTQSGQVHHFLDHAFGGEIKLTQGPAGVLIAGKLRYGDTIIIESGELLSMRALLRYLTLETDAFGYRAVSFTLYCGVNLALWAMALCVCGKVLLPHSTTLLFCLANGAAGMLICTLAPMLMDRAHLFGYRLLFAALYLASIPHIAVWIRPLLFPTPE